MIVDIIQYKLTHGISEDSFKKAAADILETWMKKQPGFLAWDIHKTEDGYVDFVHWASQEDADQAEINMKDIPIDHAWTKCYDMTSVRSKKARSVISFKNSVD